MNKLEGRGEKTVTESELRVILGKGVRGNRENKGREEHVGSKMGQLGCNSRRWPGKDPETRVRLELYSTCRV